MKRILMLLVCLLSPVALCLYLFFVAHLTWVVTGDIDTVRWILLAQIVGLVLFVMVLVNIIMDSYVPYD